MVWLVLQSAYNRFSFRLRSERRGHSLDRNERFCWDIVRRCETRDEANLVIDELRAAVANAKKGRRSSTAARRGEKWPD
jgi:hypothetical protein